MTGESVSRARIAAIAPAERVPGLYNIRLEDGEVFYDMTTNQTASLIARNGTVRSVDGVARWCLSGEEGTAE